MHFDIVNCAVCQFPKCGYLLWLEFRQLYSAPGIGLALLIKRDRLGLASDFLTMPRPLDVVVDPLDAGAGRPFKDAPRLPQFGSHRILLCGAC